MKGVKTPPLGSDVSHDQSSAQVGAEAAVLCLLPVLILLVSCLWQREQMGDARSEIG